MLRLGGPFCIILTSGLFKNKAIKAKLEGYEIPDFDLKLAKVKAWHEAYENKSLHKKSESQCEQAFNQSFFIEILGYKGFPNEIYTIDPKGNVEAGGQKPDAILGYFSEEKRRVIAVVEIKDVNTSLDKSQKREGSLSPVQQAFKYKPQYKECDFVIATNFFEIRLLKDNQLDFESFTLESLVDPKDNYFQFRKFYYLLNAENFIAKSGETNTLKLLSDIRIEQEQITKEFYRKYRDLRQELIKNILKNNQEARLRESFYVLAVEKAQKIIDRLVFVCFCEDLDLLPDDKLQEVVFHTEKLGLTIPIWDIMKSFFTAIDRGSEKLGIPDGYNGELFKEDEALNGLKIDDEICKKFVELGKYDFGEDLSVNILGHIFEQSISDLEELKSIAEKTTEEPEAHLKTSKRKKDGIYYTPDYIVDYIVKNSLGRYLEEQEQFILTKHGVNTDLTDENYYKRMRTAYEEYREKLRNIKVLDPACGSGAFLVKVYDYFLAENKRIGAILTDISGGKGDLFNVESYIKSLLQNNIYGVDLNPESVEITKLSLWLKTARKGEKLVSLKNNIKCGNSLIDDPTIAGKREFKWESEFSEIIKNGGFDVIVGNPPYVTSKYEKINKKLKETFLSKFETAYDKIDLYTLFIEKSIKLTKNGGKIGLITPWNFMKNFYSFKIRKFILDNCQIEFFFKPHSKVFENVVVDSVISIFKKETGIKNGLISFEGDSEKGKKMQQGKYYTNENFIFDFPAEENEDKILQKMKIGSIQLGEIALNYIGIMTGDQDTMLATSPIFSNSKKVLSGKDIEKWHYFDAGMYINFDKSKIHSNDNEEVFLAKKKILLRKTGRKLIATLDTNQYFTIQSLYNIVLKSEKYDENYILSLLNSSLFTYIYNKFFITNAEVFPYIKRKHLDQFSIKIIPRGSQNPFIEKANIMLSLSENFYEKLQKSLKLLQQEFQLQKVSTKLEKFYELDFDSFIKALGIKKLDLKKKGELLDFFEKNKQEILNLKTKIEQEDQTIDNMVFDLYDLTPEEREIVLKS